MAVGQHFNGRFNWRNFALFCALMTGSTGGMLMVTSLAQPPQIAVAQPTNPVATNGFLPSLLRLNHNFLIVHPKLQSLSTELQALDQRTKTFNGKFFQDYSVEVQAIQEQLAILENQFGQFTDEDQQLAIKTDLEKLQLITQNLLKLSKPFEAGFNPKTIREAQEFLDFFKRRQLTDASYGFYGSVTQTEMRTYVNQQLQDFTDTLQHLNQAATQAAIAPDLATSVNYLYTTVSLEQATDSTSTKILQLQEDNNNLKQRLESTHRIILFLPLIVMLPTIVLVFVLFYYFAKIFQEKAEQVPNYQFSMNDIYGLEEELIARLSQKYELKPRLLERKYDAFTDKLITLATTDSLDTIIPTAVTKVERTNAEENDDSGLGVVLDGNMEDEEEDDDKFPVHLPNAYDELVDTYNNDVHQLEDGAIALAISHHESHLDDESEFTPLLMLNRDELGEYWALTFNSVEYLIPKAGIAVTVDNYSHFKNIFICYGYQHNTVQKAKLLKPARVSPNEEENTWELVQQGIVVLHCI